MQRVNGTGGPIVNDLLAVLPRKAYKRLEPSLTPVSLALGEVIDELGEQSQYAYFPTTAVISMICVMENGRATETGMVGVEGMTGVATCLGMDVAVSHSVVQVAGDAVRIRVGALGIEFKRGGALHDLLLRYIYRWVVQVSQSVGCNTHHPLEKRLSRWLLIVRDRVPSDVLLLRQEFLAQMLGTRRSAVSLAANSLKTAGLIRYTRGKITILDRSGLEASACECYAAVEAAFERSTRG